MGDGAEENGVRRVMGAGDIWRARERERKRMGAGEFDWEQKRAVSGRERLGERANECGREWEEG